MKFGIFISAWIALIVLDSLCLVYCADSNESILHDHETWSRMVRVRTLQSSNNNVLRRRIKNACMIVVFDVTYDDFRASDPPLGCELQGDDLNGRLYKMVRINGLTSKWARKNNLTSGESTMSFPDGADIIEATNQLLLPAESTIKIGRIKRNAGGTIAQSPTRTFDPSDMSWNRNLAAVVRTVLVIRIVAQDAQTTATESQLANKIFGASGDALNLKSVYDKCSAGAMVMQPVSGNSMIGTDGVYTVSLPTTVVAGSDASDIVDAAIAKATIALGKAPSRLANHVMFCIPPGTGAWIAYASVNHWQSAYNDAWCTYPSSQAHEIGHNLGLDHGGLASAATPSQLEYGDKSGFMGFSFAFDEGPIMCFNAAHFWQLGWYSSYRVDRPVSGNYLWSGTLIGFAAKDSAIASDRMTIRIRDALDYYIHFNNQVGINAETKLGGDKVLVTSRASGLGPALTSVQAQLVQYGYYSFPIFDANGVALTVYVHEIDLSSTPARASVSLQFGIPTQPPTSAPTRTPARAPTRLPTSAPTRVPTRAPTRLPTSSPTTSPTRAPTLAPTRKPTASPTALPTGAPTRARTSSPTGAPTQTPTASPTDAPTQIPTSSPTDAPTQNPTALPTDEPTPTLTASPSVTPSHDPSSPPMDGGPSPPTISPTPPVTLEPVTSIMTFVPASSPSFSPTPTPTEATTSPPMQARTIFPTRAPNLSPTSAPTSVLTKPPTRVPISTPSRAPTKLPTTIRPTTKPTRRPTQAPTKRPPTRVPTRAPSISCNRNGICEPGETCVSCPYDCRGGFSGYPVTDPNCCIGGACVDRCTTATGWKCM